jgi:Plasmid pRiA4b ORF-3-like protein
MSQPSTPPSVYHRHIVLRGISLLIWRRLLVRSDTTLTHLHAIRQIVSTQSDKPLYRFHTYDRGYKSNGAQTSHVLPCDLGLLGVAVGQQIHGALQAGKQYRHLLALPSRALREVRIFSTRCAGV